MSILPPGIERAFLLKKPLDVALQFGRYRHVAIDRRRVSLNSHHDDREEFEESSSEQFAFVMVALNILMVS